MHCVVISGRGPFIGTHSLTDLKLKELRPRTVSGRPLFDLTFAEPIRSAKVRSKCIFSQKVKPRSEVISLSLSLSINFSLSEVSGQQKVSAKFLVHKYGLVHT